MTSADRGISDKDMLWAEGAVRSFDELSEWPAACSGLFPARLALRTGHNIEALAAISPGYERKNLLEVLQVISAHKLPRKHVILSHLGVGLPVAFWSTVFDSVLGIMPDLSRTGFLETERVVIGFGSVDNTRFLYTVADRITAPAIMVLDEDRYSRFISPYYLLGKRLGSPATCLFFNRASGAAQRQTAARFIEDLRSGFLDGERHDIVPLSADAPPSVAVEIRV